MRSVLSLLIATCLWAEAVVNVTVDQRQIDEGSSITLTISAKNLSSELDVELPKIPNFRVVSGPNKSSSTNVPHPVGIELPVNEKPRTVEPPVDTVNHTELAGPP